MQQGYTLPELMLVLMITGLLAQAISQQWQPGRGHQQLAQRAGQIAAFIQRLQWQAAWGNHLYRIRVIPGRHWSICLIESPPTIGIGRRPDCLRALTADGALMLSATGSLTLSGLRYTATPAHLRVSSTTGAIRIVLSGRGRLRLCADRGHWAHIPPC